MNLEIVSAGEKHLYSITAMTRHFFPYTGFTFETIRERLKSKRVFYFAALSAGHTVGFSDIEIQDDGNAKLLGLAVLKELQGRGIGKKLLSHSIGFAREKKCPSIFLFVAEDNAIAKKLYEENGFTKKGVLAEKLNDKTVLVYELKL